MALSLCLLVTPQHEITAIKMDRGETENPPAVAEHASKPTDGEGGEESQKKGADITIEALRYEHMREVANIMKEAFNSKTFLFCFPATDTEAELRQKYNKYPQGKWDLAAVAVDGQGRVMGYTQLLVKGHPGFDGLHTCNPNEMYIELICVASAARGKGVGTRLLNWCEETARNYKARKITQLTLSVLKGNRAIGLYERFGFAIKDTDPVEVCCSNVVIFCIFGRPYGCCHPDWGAHDMVKHLS